MVRWDYLALAVVVLILAGSIILDATMWFAKLQFFMGH